MYKRQDYEVPSGEEGLQAPSSAAHEAAVEDAQGDPFSTTAMPPIDVSGLRLDDMPPISDVPMPSFLDPRKVQEEARAAQADMQRSGNRVDVTGAPIGASGRIDVDIESYEVSTEEAVSQVETSAPVSYTHLDVYKRQAGDYLFDTLLAEIDFRSHAIGKTLRRCSYERLESLIEIGIVADDGDLAPVVARFGMVGERDERQQGLQFPLACGENAQLA